MVDDLLVPRLQVAVLLSGVALLVTASILGTWRLFARVTSASFVKAITGLNATTDEN
jgi:hypothetical protein